MTHEPDPEARFRQAEGLEINEVPDGYVIYEQTAERVHFLNSTAALVFELCDSEHSVREIQVIISEGFELGSDLLTLASECISELLREGLVQECFR